ncbi:hypothetical protein [Devosia sp.]|uniref:hypothetical protein n=1 Tax=Devosia sp. TaxID=1871048 RepID=UPI003BA8F2D1
MRDIERLLAVLSIGGSLLAGLWGNPAWFLVLAMALGGYLLREDRALRRQISDRAWPSEGFARFTFNTNLYFCVRQIGIGALVFALAGSLKTILGL